MNISRLVVAIAIGFAVVCPLLAADEPQWAGKTEAVVTSLKDLKKGPTGLRSRENGFRAIFVMNRDGSEVDFLVAAPGMIVSSDPQFSHDGKQLAFCGFPNLLPREDGRIFVVNAAEPMKGDIRDLGYGMEPAWSPDDKQIAFGINPNNPIKAESGVWIMNADGSQHRWLAEGYYPRWSPDGKQIVYHGYGRNDSTLMLVDVATGKTRDLFAGTDWSLNTFSGNWSADGKRILFAGTHKGTDCLAIYDLAADDPIRVISSGADPNWHFRGPPAWSPDGKQTVFFLEEAANAAGQRATSYLCSMSPEVPCAPIYLESERLGKVNRAPAFSIDSKRIVFSSER